METILRKKGGIVKIKSKEIIQPDWDYYRDLGDRIQRIQQGTFKRLIRELTQSRNSYTDIVKAFYNCIDCDIIKLMEKRRNNREKIGKKNLLAYCKALHIETNKYRKNKRHI